MGGRLVPLSVSDSGWELLEGRDQIEKVRL